MSHLLQSNFNLLIHGVGSKIDFLNYFCQTCLIQNHNRLVHIFNGFTATCNMRHIISAVKTHLTHVRSDLLNDSRDPFTGNMALHEKVSVLKKEYEVMKRNLEQVKFKEWNQESKFKKENYDPMAMFDSPPERTYDLFLVIHCLDAG